MYGRHSFAFLYQKGSFSKISQEYEWKRAKRKKYGYSITMNHYGMVIELSEH